jgi:alanyl-tRNA synthetase
LKGQIAMGGASGTAPADDIKTVDGIKLIAKKVVGMDLSGLRNFADTLRTKVGNGIVVVFNVSDDKVAFIVSVTEDTMKTGYNAGAIAKKISAILEGSGGGKPEFAQGGGKDPSKIDAALAKLPELLK